MSDAERRDAIRQRSAELIESSGRLLDEVARREVPSELWQPPAAEQLSVPPPVPRPRAAASPAPPMADEYARPRHDAAGRIVEVERFKGSAAQSAKSWEAWIKREIARQIQEFAGMVGQEMALLGNEQDERMRRWVEDKIAKSDSATVELILGLERKIEAPEQRLPPARPRLVTGESDAA